MVKSGVTPGRQCGWVRLWMRRSLAGLEPAHLVHSPQRAARDIRDVMHTTRGSATGSYDKTLTESWSWAFKLHEFPFTIDVTAPPGTSTPSAEFNRLSIGSHGGCPTPQIRRLAVAASSPAPKSLAEAAMHCILKLNACIMLR